MSCKASLFYRTSCSSSRRELELIEQLRQPVGDSRLMEALSVPSENLGVESCALQAWGVDTSRLALARLIGVGAVAVGLASAVRFSFCLLADHGDHWSWPMLMLALALGAVADALNPAGLQSASRAADAPPAAGRRLETPDDPARTA